MTSPQLTFERIRRPFQLLGKEYQFQFIPSIHFQEILRQVLEVLTAIDPAAFGDTGANLPKASATDPLAAEKLLRPMKKLLEEKVYDILFDVLLYQNGERVAPDILKRQTGPMEIAAFIHLLLTDGEVVRSLGVVADGLGKLMEALLGETDPAGTAVKTGTPGSMP